jgi:hypothetical protein
MKISRPILDQLSKIGTVEKATHFALLSFLRIANNHNHSIIVIEEVADEIKKLAEERNCSYIDVAYNFRFADYVKSTYILDIVRLSHNYDLCESILTFAALKILNKKRI